MPPPSASSSLRLRWLDTAFLAVALLLPLLWMPLYERGMKGAGLCDEPGHMAVIYSVAERRPLPDALPMLPGYHFIVATLGGDHPSMTLARQVSAGFGVLAAALFAFAWRRLHRQPAGAATLLFALLPLLQPFTGMAYTEAASVALVLAVWWAHDAGHRTLTAVFFAAACCTRQTNAVWGGFIILREALAAWRPVNAPRQALLPAVVAAMRRTAGVWPVLLLGAGLGAWHGSLTLGSAHGNQLTPNIATLHFAGMLAVLLGLPAWVPALGRAPRVLSAAWPGSRVKLAGFFVLGGLAAAVLAWSFANPHEWNRELFWEDCTFTLLRNWPLVWADRSEFLQALSGLALVLLAVATWRAFRRQTYRRELWIILFCGALILGTNRLVEPRYFITPVTMLLLFLEIDASLTRKLTLWFAVLCAVHAPFIARGLSLW